MTTEVGESPPENTSGQGEKSLVPEEINHWNWGAFFFTVFWAYRNGVPVKASMLFNPLSPLDLGRHGNGLAWKYKRWESLEHFKRTQRRWNWAPFIFWGGFIGIMAAIGVIIVSVVGSPLSNRAMEVIATHPLVIERLGAPVQRGNSIHVESSLNNPTMVSFSIIGTKGSAQALLKADTSGDDERIVFLQIDFGNEEAPLVLIPATQK